MSAYEPFKATDERPNLLYYVWFEKLKFCGCGSPGTVLKHLRDAMRALQDKSDAWQKAPAFGGWTPADTKLVKSVTKVLSGGQENTAAYYLTAYVMSMADLTEHGGSVPGWLTDFGREVLARLEATTEEDWSSDLDGLIDAILGEEPKP